MIIAPMLQQRKLGTEKLGKFAKNHTARKWQNLNFNPSNLA